MLGSFEPLQVFVRRYELAQSPSQQLWGRRIGPAAGAEPFLFRTVFDDTRTGGLRELLRPGWVGPGRL